MHVLSLVTIYISFVQGFRVLSWIVNAIDDIRKWVLSLRHIVYGVGSAALEADGHRCVYRSMEMGIEYGR